MFRASLVVMALAACCLASGGLGPVLMRTFGVFSEEPLTASEAVKMGYVLINDTCDEVWGLTYAYKGEVTKSNPALLYYTTAGQLAGFGTRIYGEPPKELVPSFWRPVEAGVYEITMSTRSGRMACSGQVREEAVGNWLSINGDTTRVPTDVKNAEYWGWTKGNCIAGMGVHWSADITGAGQMSWDQRNLWPVMPMYDTESDQVTAVLLEVPLAQKTEPMGPWEGPFPSQAFCANWCSSSPCKWVDKSYKFFSSMHWMFRLESNISSCKGHYC